MRAAVWQGKGDLRIEEVKVPTLVEGEALIKVSYAGICGSDVHIFDGVHPRSRPPLILGHEFSGEVAEIRSTKDYGLKVGERVLVEPLLFCGECYSCRTGNYHVCKTLGLYGVDVNGGFADYVKVAVSKVYKIPEGVSLEEVTLTEPLSVGVHAIRRSNLKVGDFVVVLGAGPIGMLLSQAARIGGASCVVISEINDYRLEIAKKLGFYTVDVKREDLVKQVMELTSGNGADIVFDAAASSATAKQLVALTRNRGEVVIVGIFEGMTPIDLQNVGYHELTIIGSRVYNFLDFKESLNLIATGKVNARLLISHKMDLGEVKEGIETIKKGANVMKILLKP